MVKIKDTKAQHGYKAPTRFDQKRFSSWLIIVKLSEVEGKERVLRIGKGIAKPYLNLQSLE